jgi:hypothetical protein
VDLNKNKRIVTRTFNRVVSFLIKRGCNKENADAIAISLLLNRERCKYEKVINPPA